jgi:hypothetical protein
MNKYVLIRKHSAGNESVGEMWDETIIFDGSATLDQVMAWGMSGDHVRDSTHSRQNITITKPHKHIEG